MKKINIIFLFLLSVLIFVGCGKDSAGERNAADNDSDLEISIPQSGTYGLTSEEERKIDGITVLLFNGNNQLHKDPIYMLASEGTIIGSEIEFKIPVQTMLYSDIVILANSKLLCESVLSTTSRGKPKSAILELLKFEHTGKWVASSGAIPMWGSTGQITVTKNKAVDMKLVRMLARVDVDITKPLVADILKIKEIFVYNSNSSGQIIPADGNWDVSGSVATAATIPATPSQNVAPLGYTAITAEKSCVGEIYIFEAKNTVVANPLKATCLILRARYKTDAVDTYYKVYLDKSVGGLLVTEDVLRNHNYQVNIVSVSGSGYPDPGEALEKGTANIKTEIVAWNNNDNIEGVVDGDNVFKVSKGSFYLDAATQTDMSTGNKLTVYSNEVKGWKVDRITYDVVPLIDWLSIEATEQSGTMGVPKDISLLLTKNTDGVTRVGYVHFRAGLMEYKLKVTHSHLSILSVEKIMFDDPAGFGIGNSMGFAEKIDSTFNITSDGGWTITSSDPTILSVDTPSGVGNVKVRLILNPNPNYVQSSYTLTVNGGFDPVVITVNQFGMDIYTDNDHMRVRAMPDANFVAACKVFTPAIGGSDGKLSIAEAVVINSSISFIEKSISSLKGIEYFRRISGLHCNNNQLTSLDVSKNRALEGLYCQENQLTTLDLSNNRALTFLYCNRNRLSSMDLSESKKLTNLLCYNNQLTELDVSNNTALKILSCNINKLKTLVLNKNTALTGLFCASNELTSLDVNTNTALMYLHCYDNPLTSLVLTYNIALEDLHCYENKLTSLLLKTNIALKELRCNNNELIILELSKNIALEDLRCNDNLISDMVVSGNEKLRILDCSNNKITALAIRFNPDLTSLYCFNNSLNGTINSGLNKALEVLHCYGNQLTSLDVSENKALTELHCNDNLIGTLGLSENIALTSLYCNANPLKTLDISKNTKLEKITTDPNPPLTKLVVWWTSSAPRPETITSWGVPQSVPITYAP